MTSAKHKTTLEESPMDLFTSDVTSIPNVNDQQQSPLFSTIPPEIRITIFRLALKTADNLDKPYINKAVYYRPDHQYAHISHTALVNTCKRIYEETKGLPWRLREHTFWCNNGPPGCGEDSMGWYLAKLSEEQRQAIGPVQIVTQLYWLEQAFPEMCVTHLQGIRHLRITLRYSDWWYWEKNQPLRLEREWTNGLKSIEKLEVFEFEMEVVKRDQKQVRYFVPCLT